MGILPIFFERPRTVSELIEAFKQNPVHLTTDTRCTRRSSIPLTKGTPMIAKCQLPRVSLGQVVATPGALTALENACQSTAEFLSRHAQGDRGAVCKEDREANEEALTDGSRLLSAYRTSLCEKLWTEAVDEEGQPTSDDDSVARRILRQRLGRTDSEASFRPLENESAWFL